MAHLFSIKTEKQVDALRERDRFLREHPELGYRSVSEYLIELIRSEAKSVLGMNPNMKISKKKEIMKE